MLSIFGTIASSIQTGAGIIQSVNDYSIVSFELCSFSVPESELPPGAGYFFLSAEDSASTSYNLSSFSVPFPDLQPTYPVDPAITFSLSRASIYGVESDALVVIDPKVSFLAWAVSSADTFGYEYATTTGYFSGGLDPKFDASVQPINVKAIAVYNGKTYNSSNEIFLSPYTGTQDIPNLQLWLDGSDASTIAGSYDSISDYGYYFDGTLNRVTVDNTTGWSLSTQDFTVEFYVRIPFAGRVNNTLSLLRIVHFLNTSNTGTIFGIDVDDGQSGSPYPRGTVRTTNGLVGTTNVGDNKWHHIAVVRESGIMKLFVDGTQEGADLSYSNNITVSNTINVNGVYSGSTYGGWFKGYLSNLRITQNECLYSSNFTRPALPLSNTVSGGGTVQTLAFTTSSLTNYGDPANGITTYGTFATTLPDEQLYVLDYWTDKSLNALTAVNPKSLSVPQLTSVNGLSAFVFDGVDDYLTLSSSVDTVNNFTSFFVHERRATGHRSVSIASTNDTSPYLHWSDNYIYSGNNRTTNTVLNTGIIIGAVRKNESTVINGTQIPFAARWGGTKGNSHYVGRYKTSWYHNGAFCEYIQTSCMLPDNELQLVTQTLSAKWK